MKLIGKRVEPKLSMHASGEMLAESVFFSASVAQLSAARSIRKGIYRFNSHEAANQYDQDCLIQAMASEAVTRRNG